MLLLNALCVLDSLGLFERVRDYASDFEHLDFRNEDGEITPKCYFGHERSYGYKAWRIHQSVIGELK